MGYIAPDYIHINDIEDVVITAFLVGFTVGMGFGTVVTAYVITGIL